MKCYKKLKKYCLLNTRLRFHKIRILINNRVFCIIYLYEKVTRITRTEVTLYVTILSFASDDRTDLNLLYSLITEKTTSGSTIDWRANWFGNLFLVQARSMVLTAITTDTTENVIQKQEWFFYIGAKSFFFTWTPIFIEKIDDLIKNMFLDKNYKNCSRKSKIWLYRFKEDFIANIKNK